MPEAAAVTAMRTAGRSVLTAGTTVAIGMLGLLVLRQQLLNGVAVAAAATVAMTVLGSLTLLPALLGFTGTRLGKPSRIRLPKALRRRSARRDQPVMERDGRGAIRSGKIPAAERWAARGAAPAGARRGSLRRSDPGARGTGARHEAEHAG